MAGRLGENRRELSATIPGARLVNLEGDIHLPWLGDSDAVVRHVLEFLCDEETPDLPGLAAQPAKEEEAVKASLPREAPAR